MFRGPEKNSTAHKGASMEWISGTSRENEWGGVPYYRAQDETVRAWRDRSRAAGYSRSRPSAGKKAKYAMLAPHLVYDASTQELVDMLLSYSDMRMPVSDSGILFYKGSSDPATIVGEDRIVDLWKGSMTNFQRMPRDADEYAFAVYVQKFRRGGVVLKSTQNYTVLKPYTPIAVVGRSQNTWSVPTRDHDVSGRSARYPYTHKGVKMLTKT